MWGVSEGGGLPAGRVLNVVEAAYGVLGACDVFLLRTV